MSSKTTKKNKFQNKSFQHGYTAIEILFVMVFAALVALGGIYMVNAVGPKGEQGSQGTQGSMGKQGVQGPTGDQGPVGWQGLTGDIGAQGSRGFTGAQGFMGLMGLTGLTGFQGLPGSQGTIGLTGSKGDEGAVIRNGTGAPSSELGVNGDYYINISTSDLYFKASGAYSIVVNIKGATGKGVSSIAKTGTVGLVDTYTITYSDATTSTFTVTNGATGATGSQGLIGVTGDQGLVGSQGSVGPQGPKGDIGTTGPQGAQGIAGPAGGFSTSNITYVSYTFTGMGVSVSCPAGSMAIGGGVNSGNTVPLTSSFPWGDSSFSGWQVNFESTVTATVTVVCAISAS